jgi:hypothetical protein
VNPLHFFFNLAGALFFAYGAFMGGSEALQSFQNGDILGGAVVLPFVALFAFLAVACANFALHGEDC